MKDLIFTLISSDGNRHEVNLNSQTAQQCIKQMFDILSSEHAKHGEEGEPTLEITMIDRLTNACEVYYSGGINEFLCKFEKAKESEANGGLFMLEPKLNHTTIRVVNPANAWQECKWDIFIERNPYGKPDVAFYRIMSSGMSSNILMCLEPEGIKDYLWESTGGHSQKPELANKIIQYDGGYNLTMKIAFSGTFGVTNTMSNYPPESIGDFSGLEY